MTSHGLSRRTTLDVSRSTRGGGLSLGLALALLAPTGIAQAIVRYGDPVVSGTITQANQTHRFLLMGARAGDVLRVSFSSYSRFRYYYHQLAVSFGAKPIGSVVGAGTLTAKLPSDGTYTITVRARDGRSTGWYAFRLDRLNDPVSAERTALGWNMRGALSRGGDFRMFTLHAERDAKALLRLTSLGNYAQVVDATGKQIASVTGTSTSAPFTFPSTAVYILFVAARDTGGSYAASVDCLSWPQTPCDSTPHASNYGKGWRGTHGVPSLTAATAPRTGSVLHVDVGNSYGKPTSAVVLLGVDAGFTKLAGYGGTILVSPAAHFTMQLGPSGSRWSFLLPPTPLLHGIGFGMQSVVRDPGAKPAGWAFSRGLLLVPGK